MKVTQSGIFARTVKKLRKNEKNALDKAIKDIIEKPELGDLKKGDLKNVRVYKFKVIHHQYLLAYRHDKSTLSLLALGTHENFYRDLKKTS